MCCFIKCVIFVVTTGVALGVVINTEKQRDKFLCKNGQMIEVYQRCDGTSECSDSSDESFETCSSTVCPSHMFQCAYGACVDGGAECNNLTECADNSDEWNLLCKRTSSPATTTTTEATPTACVLPDHPKYGVYSFTDGSKYIPGSAHEIWVELSIICYPGFQRIGAELIYCHLGKWFSDFPYCSHTCKLERSPSIEYRCITKNEETRECDEYELEDTVVQPECRKPNYYSATDLSYMVCYQGKWNYQPRCEPECGTLTPQATPLVVGGRKAEVGEVPWHAGVYTKKENPPQQICGASLLSEKVLVSAAHCFWNNNKKQLQPSEDYAIAVGKLYREWGHPVDQDKQQTSDVQSIYISHHYRGDTLNYQHDLAMIIVKLQFSYRPYIRPICIHFPTHYNEMKLENNLTGKVAGWGLTTVYDGSESSKLKVLDIPFVDFDECLFNTPDYYHEFFGGDKFCGGFANGTSLCKGDSGGGFAFQFENNGRKRYYLRGIVSTSPPLPGGLSCNTYSYTSFTNVLEHKKLIMRHIFN